MNSSIRTHALQIAYNYNLTSILYYLFIIYSIGNMSFLVTFDLTFSTILFNVIIQNIFKMLSRII